MSITSTERTYFGDETGADGRAITDVDLNAISNNMTRRAWEIPGYADIIAFDQIEQTDAIDYAMIWQAYNSSNARSGGVFTRGGGLQPYRFNALQTSIRGGLLGVWNMAGTQLPPAPDGVANMMWLQIHGTSSGSFPRVTHDDCAAGHQRWDLVVCTVSEVDSAAVQRHWEDAVTGAKTSQGVVPAKKMELSYSVVKGTPVTTAVAPDPPGYNASVPQLPAGQHVLYAVLIDGDQGGADVADIKEYRDLTIPTGRLRKVMQPASTAVRDADWTVGTVDHSATTTATSAPAEIVFFPPFSGDGEVRILAVKIAYKLASGSYTAFRRMTCNSPGGQQLIMDITRYLNTDGADHETLLDLRGAPSLAQNPLSAFWAGGARIKEEALTNTGIALQLKGPSSDPGGSKVYSVVWYVVGGG
jgi:hypothetical protein